MTFLYIWDYFKIISFKEKGTGATLKGMPGLGWGTVPASGARHGRETQQAKPTRSQQDARTTEHLRGVPGHRSLL